MQPRLSLQLQDLADARQVQPAGGQGHDLVQPAVHAHSPAPTAMWNCPVAERPADTFTQQVFLGDTLDAGHVEAGYTAGVLTLSIPVHEAAKPRKIEITSQDASRSAQVHP